jgi:hypothetical protein
MWLAYAFSGPLLWAASTHIDNSWLINISGTAAPPC